MFARQKLCSIHNNNHNANVRKAIWGNNGAASARALKVAVAENKMERETQRARDRVVESSRCPLPGVYMLAVRPSHCRWSHMRATVNKLRAAQWPNGSLFWRRVAEVAASSPRVHAPPRTRIKVCYQKMYAHRRGRECVSERWYTIFLALVFCNFLRENCDCFRLQLSCWKFCCRVMCTLGGNAFCFEFAWRWRF